MKDVEKETFVVMSPRLRCGGVGYCSVTQNALTHTVRENTEGGDRTDHG